jgi:hypothetical protein
MFTHIVKKLLKPAPQHPASTAREIAPKIPQIALINAQKGGQNIRTVMPWEFTALL